MIFLSQDRRKIIDCTFVNITCNYEPNVGYKIKRYDEGLITIGCYKNKHRAEEVMNSIFKSCMNDSRTFCMPKDEDSEE